MRGSSRALRRSLQSGVLVLVVLVVSACSAEADPPASDGLATTSSTIGPSTTEPLIAVSTTGPPTAISTTTAAVADVSTLPFTIEVGTDGVTYDLDGAPPSGPSSFAVLDDGSVVIADTMAVSRAEPRLLHFDRSGELQAVIGLANEEVAAIVDVVTDGSNLAILDVLVSMNRYRVLTLGADGEVGAVIDVPAGFHFEDGLTGLAWDDSGILLEFELGARYARLTEAGGVESAVVPVFDGVSIELTSGDERTTEVTTSRASFSIVRTSGLGGASLVGIGPDGSIVIVVDEVDTSGAAIRVTRRVQRYSAAGELEAEQSVDAADQFLDIPRPFELDATGEVLYLRARSDRITIGPLEQ